MTAFTRALFTLLCLIGFNLALAQDALSLAEVKPGMTGYGLTAGPGNLIARFSAEVLAVQEGMGPGFPLVLIRTGGDFIDQSGGVAAGMSGSPIYIEGRLLGALAYAFPQSDHRLALVTPAEVLLAAAPGSSMHAAPALGELGAVALRAPVLVTGLNARAAREVTARFDLFGGEVVPLQAGRMNAQEDEAYKLEPGSAVAVELVRGDVSLAAVGTVTHVDGERVWAFGHPLLERGAVSFALTPAFVSHIVPSLSLPFKLANSGRRLLGTIDQDRPHGVSGFLGADPGFIPVTLFVDGPEGSSATNFEVTSDERFYAPLLFAASLQAIDETLAQLSGGTAELVWEITLQGGRTLRLIEQDADGGDVAVSAALLAAAPLETLAQNAFAAPEVTAIKLTVRVERERRVASLVRAVAENELLEAGGTLVAHLRLQPFRGEARVETVRVPIPEDVEALLEVSFRGGLEPSPEEAEGGEHAPLSFSELLKAMETRPQASDIVAEAFVDGSYRQLARVALPFLIEGVETLTVEILGAGEVPERPGAPEPAEEEPAPLPAPEPEEIPPPPVPLPDATGGLALCS